MKHLLLILLYLALTLPSSAQTGPGIVFTHDPATGFRVKREYRPNAQLAKPGKDTLGQTADTIIGYYQEESDKTFNDDKIFVRAYPNPVHDILFIENLSWTEGSSATLKLSDVSGKEIMIKSTTLPKETITLSSLAPGTYHVKYYKDNVYVISWQIVKL